MRRRYLLAIVIVLILVLFVALQPVSGPESQSDDPVVTETEAQAETQNLSLPTLAACAGSPPSRLRAESEAAVAPPGEGGIRRNLVVRSQPGGQQVGLMEPGTRFRITGDSICDRDGLRWRPVEY
ncbi:MAG: hypothetical protein K8L99_10235, partial [Anaerolineae bacterium]|nr:hypothetical protein [Anaerolineae bacterium]